MVARIYIFFVILVGVNAEGPRLSVPATWIVTYPEEAFNLVCTGNKPLTWQANHVPSSYYNITNSEENGKFVSVFQIMSPVSSDTGLFQCHYDTKESDSSYVYVYGGEEAFVLDPEPHHIVMAEIGKNFTLDCRVTHPDIDVYVQRHSEIISWSNLENVTEFFDKDAYGSFTKRVDSLQDSGRYVCKENRFGTKLQIYLNVQTPPSPLHAPSIKEYTNAYHVAGLPINLNCSVPNAETPIKLNWTLPNPQAVHDIVQLEVQFMTTYTVSMLTIAAASYEDSGDYMCTASKGAQLKNTTKEITVKESEASFVSIDRPPKVLPISENEDFQWIITVAVYPEDPVIAFYDPMGDIMNPSQRVKMTFDYPTGQLCLRIQRIQASDFGRYTVNVTTKDGLANDSQSVVMYVMAKPSINFLHPVDYLVQQGDPVNISTEILSFDKESKAPDVTWLFITNCPHGIGQCLANQDSLTIESTERPAGIPKNRWFSDVDFVPDRPGELRCRVTNEFGQVQKSMQILLADSDEAFILQLYSESGIQNVIPGSILKIVEHDDVTIRCSALRYVYVGVDLYSSSDLQTYDCSTHLSHGSCINVNQTDSSFTQSFTCRVKHRQTQVATTKMFEVYTVDKSAPLLIRSRSSVSEQGTLLDTQLGDALDISCVVDGQPKPNITWLLDDVRLEDIPEFLDNDAVILDSNQELLSIKFVKRAYEGVYTCVAENREGIIQPYTTVNVKGKKLGTRAIVFIALAAGVIVMLVLVVGCLICRVKKERKFGHALRANQLYLFEKGNVGDLNQDCLLDEQADRLPYDQAYEIDRNRITVGKQLGCGAFGRVMLAELRTHSGVQQIALKMGKDISDPSHLTALIAELKILIHLGQHLNIVNLIGANTSRLKIGEMWMLVEYCKHGNLLRFIQRHKKMFMNQINPETGLIEFHRTSPFLNDPLTPGGMSYKSSLSGTDYEPDRLSPSFKLVNPHMFRKPPQTRPGSPDTHRPGFYAGNPQYSQMGSTIASSENSVNLCPEDTSSQDSPTKRHGSTSSTRSATSAYVRNVNTDMTFLSSPLSHTGIEDPQGEMWGVGGNFSTAVLVCWSWQVACGMEYLVKRKVLHGDLAARNLLLDDNNVVKISDFGLSKSIYKDNIYTKKDDGAMPIKWMSLEAIEQRLFSTQSDVWAYGVTMWELFTLGKTPYPGVAVDRDFVNQLEKGMRMEKPKYSNDELYQLMLECWNEDPTHRPSFQGITNVLADLLYPETKEQYVAMNDVHLDCNKEWFETRPDYFNLLQTPDYLNLQPNMEPAYLQAIVREEPPITNGYLPMHNLQQAAPETIFSPRLDPVDDTFFAVPLQKPPSVASNNNSIKCNEFHESDILLTEPAEEGPYVNSEAAGPYVRVGLS